MIFFTFCYFIYECYSVISSDIRHVVGLKTKPVQPLKSTSIPAGAHSSAVPFAYPRGGASFGVRRSWQKWTRVNVTLKTSSNQQVDSSGLPRIWWNRKPYFLWAATILANHSEEGGNIISDTEALPTQKDRKKKKITTLRKSFQWRRARTVKLVRQMKRTLAS